MQHKFGFVIRFLRSSFALAQTRFFCCILDNIGICVMFFFWNYVFKCCSSVDPILNVYTFVTVYEKWFRINECRKSLAEGRTKTRAFQFILNHPKIALHSIKILIDFIIVNKLQSTLTKETSVFQIVWNFIWFLFRNVELFSFEKEKSTFIPFNWPSEPNILMQMKYYAINSRIHKYS